jgi:hypothetical protein
LSRAGRHAEALEHVRQAHAVQQVMREEALRGNTIVYLGAVLALAGAGEAAALALGLAERLFEHNDFVLPPWLAVTREDAVSTCRGLLDETSLPEVWQRGRAMTEEDVFELAAQVVGEVRPSG